MVTASDICGFVDAIARNFAPERIVLFGSYAYGTPTEDSDVDLLVVADHRGPGHRQAARMRQAVDASFPLDLLVQSDARIRRRVAGNDFFLKEAIEKGLVLYAADDSRVGAQGRRRLRRRLAAAALAKTDAI